MLRLGVIADSHGRLDERVHTAFESVDAILHAGDICAATVLDELETIAPVTAVLGNCDGAGLPGYDLPITAEKTFGSVRVLVVHDRSTLGPVPEGVDVVVFGHSHMPLVDVVDGVLWLNPGSAQQARRSPLGRSVAILEIEGRETEAHLVPLDDLLDKGVTA